MRGLAWVSGGLGERGAAGGWFGLLYRPILFDGTNLPASVISPTQSNMTYSNLSSDYTDQNYNATASTYVQVLGSWVTGTTHAKETAGSNRALVFIAHAETSGVTLSTVTYGGQSMTKITDKIIGSSSSRAYVGAFILNDAGISAASDTTFSPTWSGTAPTSVTYTSVFLQNVNQTTLVGATANNGLTSAYSVATTPIATNNGDMVIEQFFEKKSRFFRGFFEKNPTIF